MDTGNKFLVAAISAARKELTILRPPLAAMPIKPDDAINLAAWLVALIPDGRDKLDRALRSIRL